MLTNSFQMGIETKTHKSHCNTSVLKYLKVTADTVTVPLLEDKIQVVLKEKMRYFSVCIA